MSDNQWKQVVEEMQRILDEVENDDLELAKALTTSHPELRQALTVALSVLTDGRKIKGAAKATDMSENYLRDHLRPLLEAVLRAEQE